MQHKLRALISVSIAAKKLEWEEFAEVTAKAGTSILRYFSYEVCVVPHPQTDMSLSLSLSLSAILH